MVKLHWPLALCALLAACENIRNPVTYLPPDSRPRARVRFVAQTGPTYVRYHPDPNSCKADLVAALGRSVLQDRGWGRSIGVPLGEAYDRRAMTEAYVPAGKPLMVAFEFSAAHRVFGMTVAFDPAPDADYEIVFVVHHLRSSGVELYRIAPSPDGTPMKVAEPSLRSASCLPERLRRKEKV